MHARTAVATPVGEAAGALRDPTVHVHPDAAPSLADREQQVGGGRDLGGGGGGDF